MVNEKNPQLPYLTMGELCLEAENKQLAIVAIRKEKKYELKCPMLIDAEAWLEATEEIFANRKHPDHEQFLMTLREKAPPFVEDFIKTE